MFLDLGCGLGQNMRKLLLDGAPAKQVCGADISSDLIACGHEYFRDVDRWQCKMYIGDLFDSNASVNAEASGQFDAIWAAMVYHLWAWDGQLKASIQTARLLKDKKGAMLIGWQLGATPAVEEKRPLLAESRSDHRAMFRHDDDSFRKLWHEVSQETGMNFEVETKVAFPPWLRDEKRDLSGSKGSILAFKVVRS
jgi:SAM-dependent methyltransferase